MLKSIFLAYKRYMEEIRKKIKIYDINRVFDYNYYLLAQYILAVFAIILFPKLFTIVMIYEAMLTIAFFLVNYSSRKYMESESIKSKSMFIIMLSYFMCFIIMDTSKLSTNMDVSFGTLINIIFIMIAIVMNIFIITYYKSLGFTFEKLGFVKISSSVIIKQIIFLIIGIFCVFIMLYINKLSFGSLNLTYKTFLRSFIIFGLSREIIFRGALLSYLSDIFSYIKSDIKRNVIVTLFCTVVFAFTMVFPISTNARFFSVILLSVYASICRLYKGHIIWPSLLHSMLILIL